MESLFILWLPWPVRRVLRAEAVRGSDLGCGSQLPSDSREQHPVSWEESQLLPPVLCPALTCLPRNTPPALSAPPLEMNPRTRRPLQFISGKFPGRAGEKGNTFLLWPPNTPSLTLLSPFSPLWDQSPPGSS